MSKVFFTADLHLGHANIIKYCNRPFSSVDEMNNVLIVNWNSRIQPQDVVYVLGDFCWGNEKHYLDALNGNKILIKGDHDKWLPENTQRLMNIKNDGQSIVLCHWCMRVWWKSHFNSWHLYGHSHGTLEPIGKSWDVGVDNNRFFPLEFSDIKEIMNNRPDNFNLIKGDRNV